LAHHAREDRLGAILPDEPLVPVVLQLIDLLVDLADAAVVLGPAFGQLALGDGVAHRQVPVELRALGAAVGAEQGGDLGAAHGLGPGTDVPALIPDLVVLASPRPLVVA